MLAGTTFTGLLGNAAFAGGNLSGVTLTGNTTYQDVRCNITDCVFETTQGNLVLEYDTAGTYELAGTKTGGNSIVLQVVSAGVNIITTIDSNDYLNGTQDSVTGATDFALVQSKVIVTDGTGDVVGGHFSIFNNGVEIANAAITVNLQEIIYQGSVTHWVWSRPGFQTIGGAGVDVDITVNPLTETGGGSTNSSFSAAISFASNVGTITISSGGSGPSDTTNSSNTYGMLENLKGSAEFNAIIGYGLSQSKTIFSMFRKEGPADSALDSDLFTFRSNPTSAQTYIGGVVDTTGQESSGISTVAIPGQTFSQVLNLATPTASISNVQEALKLILNAEDENENLLFSIGRRLKSAINRASRSIPAPTDDKLG